MIDLAANAYNFEKKAAEEYLADYSDDELRNLLRAQLEKLVTEKYAEQAELQVAQMMAFAAVPGDLFNAQGYAAVAAAFDQMITATTDETVLAGYYDEYMPSTVSGSTLSNTLAALGSIDYDTPNTINIYAEAVIVGFTAGLIGIGVTLLLNLPISIIAEKLTGISGIAVLPATAAVILVAVSVILTMIAGLIPSRMAAKKDPVIALRTE